ncbi:hypothetical protein PBI_TOAKA_8 [Mycobacterium phage Toaka]|nr:hypothetical protein PBI_TOAKA_8 [Mycobacterium phage Toaka]
MRRKVIGFVLKLIVKYLIKHPDVIPGDLDDRALPYILKRL